MLCCSLYCFFSEPFHIALLLNKLVDLHHHHLAPQTLHVSVEGNMGDCPWGKAGMLKLPFRRGSWWITVVRPRAGGRKSSNLCMEIELERSRSSAQQRELPGYVMLLILVAARLSEGCCQPRYSRFVLMSSSSSPNLLQHNPHACRLEAGAGREAGLWTVAVFSFLFQFNLQACLFLAVPLRFSRQSQSFIAVCTSIRQIGFLTYLGYCNLESMLLSFSSGWQLKQREMCICLEVYIDIYLRNGKRCQNRPAFYCLSLCWVLLDFIS